MCRARLKKFLEKNNSQKLDSGIADLASLGAPLLDVGVALALFPVGDGRAEHLVSILQGGPFTYDVRRTEGRGYPNIR